MLTSDGKYYAGHNTLKLGPELIVKTNAATLLRQIEKDAPPFFFKELHTAEELLSTVTLQASKKVPRETR